MQRIRENSGTSMKAESTPTAAAPTKMPTSAVTIGRPIATTEPNAIEQHDDGDSDADELTARVLLRELRHLPGEFDADPAPRAWSVTFVASSNWVSPSLSTAYATSR